MFFNLKEAKFELKHRFEELQARPEPFEKEREALKDKTSEGLDCLFPILSDYWFKAEFIKAVFRMDLEGGTRLYLLVTKEFDYQTMYLKLPTDLTSYTNTVQSNWSPDDLVREVYDSFQKAHNNRKTAEELFLKAQIAETNNIFKELVRKFNACIDFEGELSKKPLTLPTKEELYRRGFANPSNSSGYCLSNTDYRVYNSPAGRFISLKDKDLHLVVKVVKDYVKELLMLSQECSAQREELALQIASIPGVQKISTEDFYADITPKPEE